MIKTHATGIIYYEKHHKRFMRVKFKNLRIGMHERPGGPQCSLTVAGIQVINPRCLLLIARHVVRPFVSLKPEDLQTLEVPTRRWQEVDDVVADVKLFQLTQATHFAGKAV